MARVSIAARLSLPDPPPPPLPLHTTVRPTRPGRARAPLPLPRPPLAPPGTDPGQPPLRFAAPDFDTLVDSPIELGTHRVDRFDVLGTPHRLATWPPALARDADVKRLVDDTGRIVETLAAFFGGTLPYRAYDLLLHLASRGRGGLEHAASACLIAPASSFGAREGYLDLLSLVAHEMVHAWNGKRIRPAS